MAVPHELDDGLLRLLAVTRDAVFVATEDGRILAGNDAVCAMFGYHADDLRGLRWRDVTAAPGTPLGGIATLVRNGGERFEAELTTTEFYAPSGEARMWIAVHDVSERRRTEQAAQRLRDSEETFRALAEASFEGLFLQREGRILLANAAVERMHGYPRGSMIGMHILDCVAPEVRDDIQRRVAALSEEPYETLGLRADGTRFHAEVRARTGPVNFRGEPVRVVAVRDVSARKQLEAKLALADRMASLGTLAAGVAHEINNPLAAVMLSIELAKKEVGRGATPGRMLELLADASEGAERVRRIVKDLRALARPDDEPIAQIDVREVIAYANSVASYQLRHRARVDVRVAALGPIYSSRARLEQVILNLLVNAAQAIPDDRDDHRIEIEVREAGDEHFAIEVRDTGIGIAPELRERIFDPFVTTKPVGEGTGLGLSICHSIVTSLGGTIDVDSEVGRGTTLRIVLPKGQPPAPRSSAITMPARAARRANILIIDDERPIRETLMHLLGDHRTTSVSDAREALSLLDRGETFDVILCDLMMPGMSGIDFHDEVERRWPPLVARILVMTGGAVTARSQALLARATHAPLEKPFPPRVLEARIAELLDRSQTS